MTENSILLYIQFDFIFEIRQLQSKREMFFKSETLPAGAGLSGSSSATASTTNNATPASSATGAQQPVGNIASLKESLLANKENHTTATTTSGGPQTSSSSTTLTGSISNNSSHGSVPGLASTGSKVLFFNFLSWKTKKKTFEHFDG